MVDWSARTLINRMKPNEVEQTSLEAANAIGGDRVQTISTDSTGGTSRGSRIGVGRLFGRMRRLDRWWYQPRSRPWSSILIYFRSSFRVIAIKDSMIPFILLSFILLSIHSSSIRKKLLSLLTETLMLIVRVRIKEFHLLLENKIIKICYRIGRKEGNKKEKF